MSLTLEKLLEIKKVMDRRPDGGRPKKQYARVRPEMVDVARDLGIELVDREIVEAAFGDAVR